MTYFQHNDAKGLSRRLTVAASKQERAHAEALAEERRLDPWGITLYMSKYDIKSRLSEAAFTGTEERL